MSTFPQMSGRLPRADVPGEIERWASDVSRWASQVKKYYDERYLEGEGAPEGAVTASVGAVYRRLDGGAGTSLYVKESGTGDTGWVGK